jgi:alpha-maltose-1-phosphate synthase
LIAIIPPAQRQQLIVSWREISFRGVVVWTHDATSFAIVVAISEFPSMLKDALFNRGSFRSPIVIGWPGETIHGLKRLGREAKRHECCTEKKRADGQRTLRKEGRTRVKREMVDFGVYYETDAYSFKNKVMGRQSAGIGFMRAVANAGPEKLWCYAHSQSAAKECADMLSRYGAKTTAVVWVPLLQPNRLAEAGLLYRPGPMIAIQAWQRLQYASPNSYSLCGVTHTTATDRIMEALTGMLVAPLEDWDGVICTSRAVRDSVKVLVESQSEYLRERLGATRLSLPQLPVIPLGVHCADFIFSDGQRQRARQALGITREETVVLFVGRLSFHGKAHPAAMYMAAEACSSAARITLIQAGWFANAGIESAFKRDASVLCPSVRCLYVDARQKEPRANAWAAADVFISVSDNIQETFGLTPLEAMAAGLPVIVSDWDGYRDTVRHGTDGFRIPTLSMPPGSGSDLADRYDLGIDNYDRYCGYNSQLVAVDIHDLSSALRMLVSESSIRRAMGQAGRKRARDEFDWAVVFNRYQALWKDLAERRGSNAACGTQLSRRKRPDRPDPFTLFSGYPSVHIGPQTEFQKLPGIALDAAVSRRELHTTNFATLVLPDPELISDLMAQVADDAWTEFHSLARVRSGRSEVSIARALVWLTKMGVFRFRNRSEPEREH